MEEATEPRASWRQIANGEGPAIGSEQAAGVINATFEDLRLGKMQDGPTVKSCRGRGGLVEVRNHPAGSTLA